MYTKKRQLAKNYLNALVKKLLILIKVLKSKTKKVK